jgi:vancomycin permeability regulator SanA
LALFLLLVVLSAVPTVWERSVAHSHLRTADSVPHVSVGIVLGALVDGDRPSAFLASRLDVALGLYQRHQVDVLLVSGADDHHGYDEPDVMRNYLVARGVPAGRVVVDRGGTNTWDSCVRARRVFGLDQAILVTQAFHVARAIALCRANGVYGYGVGIDSADIGMQATVYGYFREYFAADKAMWDALVSHPAVPGSPDNAVTTALGH